MNLGSLFPGGLTQFLYIFNLLWWVRNLPSSLNNNTPLPPLPSSTSTSCVPNVIHMVDDMVHSAMELGLTFSLRGVSVPTSRTMTLYMIRRLSVTNLSSVLPTFQLNAPVIIRANGWMLQSSSGWKFHCTFALMTTGAFSQNNGKLFSKFMQKQTEKPLKVYDTVACHFRLTDGRCYCMTTGFNLIGPCQAQDHIYKVTDIRNSFCAIPQHHACCWFRAMYHSSTIVGLKKPPSRCNPFNIVVWSILLVLIQN